MHIYLYRSKNTCRGMLALKMKMIRLWHKLLFCVTAFRCAFVSGTQILVRLCPVEHTPSEAPESRSGESGTHKVFKLSLSPNNRTNSFKSLESKHLTEGRDVKLNWWVRKARVILFFSQNHNKIKTSIGKSQTSAAVKLFRYFQFWETWS